MLVSANTSDEERRNNTEELMEGEHVAFDLCFQSLAMTQICFTKDFL